MTIYVPDELAAEVKAELGDQNISAICQDALRKELDRTKARTQIAAEGFERILLYDSRRGRNVVFKGRQLGSAVDDDHQDAYLTQKNAIAVYVHSDQSLYIYDSYEAFVDATSEEDLLAVVAEALGEEYAEELDI